MGLVNTCMALGGARMAYGGDREIGGCAMPLVIEDDAMADLVTRLAGLRGILTQDAVRLAVRAELDRAAEARPLRERFAALREAYPLPPATGEVADKAFFDGLSGET